MGTAIDSLREWARRILPTFAFAAAGAVVLSAFVVSPSEAQEGQEGLDFDTYREFVEPIFMRLHGDGSGMNPGACVMCHTWQVGTPFRLQPLQQEAGGDAYWTEALSRKNFEVVSRLVTPGSPQSSMLLRKPLEADAGGTEYHVGGKFWESQEDPEYQILANWVASAPARQAEARPRPPTVDFEFFRSCVQRVFLNPRGNAVPCAACHAGGERGFAGPIAGGRSYWNEDESRRNFAVAMRLITPGEPMQSLFMQNTLHPDAGGTPMHGGGKRWESQDDPEWQELAAWIRGENRGSTCPAPLQF